jgi:CelD/BcsL family acetyltransferase involved in cellulose biosynthesis
MRVHVVTPGELDADDQAAWRAAQAARPELSSPFLSPEFASAVDRVRPDARVAVVDDDAGRTGFLAFQDAPDHQGSPIGEGLCDAQAFVHEEGLDWSPAEIVRASGLTAWRFDHLRLEQSEFGPFHRKIHRSPVIDLSRGHESFLSDVQQISKDVLAQMGRRRRKLEREVGPVITEWCDDSDDAYGALKQWKSAQYAATGVWDRFAHPWISDLLDELRCATAPGCTGLLATTRAGDRLAAVHFGLAGVDSLSWWFPAYEPELGAYSPGLILLLDLAEQAAARSLSMIDLGRGEHGYKLRVANGSYEVAEGEVRAE